MYSHFSFYPGNLGFFVRSVGFFDLSPSERQRIKVADFGEIFWCISGSGKFEDASGKNYLLRPEYVWYYPPGSTHILGAGPEGFRYRWLTIDGPLAAALFDGLNIPVGMSCGGPCPEEVFDRIAVHISDPEDMPDVLEWAFHILSRIALGGKKQTASSSITTEVIDLIENNFKDPFLNVESIADKLGRHRVSLARIFKEQLGITISEYLQSCRCREAFHLIRETNTPLTEIPALCGFSSIHYLSRVIRKQTGFPPGILRHNSLQEKNLLKNKKIKR